MNTLNNLLAKNEKQFVCLIIKLIITQHDKLSAVQISSASYALNEVEKETEIGKIISAMIVNKTTEFCKAVAMLAIEASYISKKRDKKYKSQKSK